jgi:hypothetical protein
VDQFVRGQCVSAGQHKAQIVAGTEPDLRQSTVQVIHR